MVDPAESGGTFCYCGGHGTTRTTDVVLGGPMQTITRREHWRSRLGIVFATSGSAIGLGTLWKLPFLIGQGGGGAFIALFLGFTLLLGMPLFIAELALGKHYQKSVAHIFSHMPQNSSVMSVFGWLAIVVTFLIAGWYGVVSGWGINYLVMALTDAFSNKSPLEFATIFAEFRHSGSLNLLWQAVFVAITCLILARGIRNGIESYSKLFFSLLFILIIGLFIYATTLSGFLDAFSYLVVPDFDKVNRETVLAALGLSLFTLSLGQGIMVTYGSYMAKDESIFKTALVVSLSVVLISILIALMIFPMIFTFGFPPESGEGLLFITMPYVTERLPGSMAISALFFILLIFAALTSYMGQLEVLVSSFMDMFSFSRTRAAIVAGVGCFIVGIPTALMFSEHNPYENFDKIFHRSFLEANYIIIDWMLIIFSLGICWTVGFKLKKSELAAVLNTPIDSMEFLLWHTAIRFIVPLFILVVLFSRIGL
jgi:neurotransmitter:Na+ symporter, NSS family